MPRAVRRGVIFLTQDRFTVSVAAVITNPAGEVLLLDHRIRPGSGWGLPGGFLEKGEQPEAGLRREIKEETGLELAEADLLSVRTVGAHIEILFTARSDDRVKIGGREIKGFGWFSASGLPKEMHSDHKAVIESLLRTAASICSKTSERSSSLVSMTTASGEIESGESSRDTSRSSRSLISAKVCS